MSNRKTISREDKLKYVQLYLTGDYSMSLIVRKAGVHVSCVSTWIRRYRAEGTEAFSDSERKRKYDPDLKAQAVQEYLSGRCSMQAICEKYKIRSSAQLCEWTKVYNRHQQSEAEAGGEHV